MYNQLTNIRFTTKLFVSVVVITVASVLITSITAIRMANNGLYSLGEGATRDVHQAVFNSLVMYDSNIQRKLDGDLALFSKELQSRGALFLDEGRLIEQTMVNQFTQASETRKIPQLQVGVSYINGYYDIVDEVEKISGASATVFQKVDDKLLRISTTVRRLDGERATGTYIPSSSPVYQAIMRGETFRGKAFVVTDWYLTTYSPIRDMDGEIVGAIYVGQVMLNPEVRQFISETRMGSGFFFAYADSGEFLIHPTHKAGENIFTLLPEFVDQQEGFVNYREGGEEKVAYILCLRSVGSKTPHSAPPDLIRYCKIS